MTPAPVPPDGEKWDASNCVRFCDRCDAEYGITAGADAGDDACAGCGNLTAPHIYPHPRFAAGRAAASPDPTLSIDYIERQIRDIAEYVLVDDSPEDPASDADVAYARKVAANIASQWAGHRDATINDVTPAASPDRWTLTSDNPAAPQWECELCGGKLAGPGEKCGSAQHGPAGTVVYGRAVPSGGPIPDSEFGVTSTVLDPETGIAEPVTTGRIPDAEFVEPPLMPPAASTDMIERAWSLISDGLHDAWRLTVRRAKRDDLIKPVSGSSEPR